MLTATGSPNSVLRIALPIMLAATASPCLAEHTVQPFLSLGDRIEVPRGFAEMCTTTTDFCSTTPASSDAAIVTAALAGSQGGAPSGAGFSTSALALGGLAIVSSTPSVLSATEGVAIECGPGREISNSRVTSFFSFEDSRDRYSDTACSGLAQVVTRPEPIAAAFVPPATIALEPKATAKLLKRVNRYVNSRVQQRTDFEIYARDELWVRSGVGPKAMGDCEDIAIEKRYELVSQGYPPDRLTFAVVFSAASGLHTVLIAKTNDGDVVLDSRTPYIRRWSEVGYSWISVQTAADPMVWRRVV
ncbi:MAG: transglutaminase family protein cysteine peptidase [Sphingomonadales bacterium]|nr:transglutaminase family protein cysteine peptidase [Sphingomonadales bacterium]